MPAQRIFALCELCNILVVSSQNYAKVRKGGLPGFTFYYTGKDGSASPSTGSTRREQYRLVSISRPV